MHTDFDLGAVDWYSVLPEMGIDAKYLTATQGPCPMCGGNTRFRFDNKNREGTWYCNKCGAGNGITLVARVNEWSNGVAFAAIAARTRGEDGQRAAVRPVLAWVNREPKRDELRCKLQRTWDEAIAVVAGDPVWRYLHARIPRLAGDIPAANVLRHHPSLPYFEAYRDRGGRERYRGIGRFAAMLTKICDREGTPVNLHRTYLGPDGRKAQLPAGCKAKKSMTGVAKFTGGAIRLFAPDGSGQLGVGEGIETMLAVRAGYQHRLPVWPCVSDGGLRKFSVPEWVTELHVFADNDPPDDKGRRPGPDSAVALVKRVRAEGRKAVLHMPRQTGTDFLDEWVALQGAELRTA